MLFSTAVFPQFNFHDKPMPSTLGCFRTQKHVTFEFEILKQPKIFKMAGILGGASRTYPHSYIALGFRDVFTRGLAKNAMRPLLGAVTKNHLWGPKMIFKA